MHSVLAELANESFNRIVESDVVQLLSQCNFVSALSILRRAALNGSVKLPISYVRTAIYKQGSTPSKDDYRAAVEALEEFKVLNKHALNALHHIGSDRYREGVIAIDEFMAECEQNIPEQKRASKIILDKLESGPYRLPHRYESRGKGKSPKTPGSFRSGNDRGSAGRSCAEEKFAYMTVLWEPLPLDEAVDALPVIIDAMVLGESLSQSGTPHDKVLLATPEILQHPAAPGLMKFWKIREIEHMSTEILAGTELSCHPRFSNVLTKLQVLNQVDYEKVVLLDSDIILMHNCDELFDLPAPAALMRGPRDHKPDSVRPSRTYRRGGINGGVVLLEPNTAEYKAIRATLRGDTADKAKWLAFLKGCTGPEQDFIGEWYGACQELLRGLHPKYNYQLHILLFHPDEENDRRTLRYKDISLFHFSTKHKPSVFLLKSGLPNFDDWLKELFSNSRRAGK